MTHSNMNSPEEVGLEDILSCVKSNDIHALRSVLQNW